MTTISVTITQNWDVSYAEDMFYRGHGDCFAFASAFAYLANAVGFEAKVISSGGHGWAEIKGEVCDPNWAKGTGHIERYYRMSYDLSGVDGRPYYRGKQGVCNYNLISSGQFSDISGR